MSLTNEVGALEGTTKNAPRLTKVQPCRLMRGLGPHIFRRRSLIFKYCARTVVCSINRAPAKLVALWEEEQTRSSSICSANSYDKRIATSERSYVEIGESSIDMRHPIGEAVQYPIARRASHIL